MGKSASDTPGRIITSAYWILHRQFLESIQAVIKPSSNSPAQKGILNMSRDIPNMQEDDKRRLKQDVEHAAAGMDMITSPAGFRGSGQ